MSLTLKGVERLKGKPGRYGDGGGLYLQIETANSASWSFRYERAGRERWMGLGSLATFDLHEARERARKARQQLAEGTDPLDAREADKAASAARKTFKECSETFYATNKEHWKNPKHREQFISTLRTYAYPILGHLAVADIDVTKVLAVLEQDVDGTTFWKAKGETARRVRSRMETVIGWATVRGYRPDGDNPARWRGFLSTQLKGKRTKRPQPSLPYERIGEFIADLQKRTGTAARALEFLILTAARSGAVTGARRDEIDPKEKVWSVPPERAGTKIYGDKPRRVPLCDRATEILQELPVEDGNPFLFIGPSAGCGLSDAALRALIQRMNGENGRTGRPRYVDPKLKDADIVPHGFRSTFKDWASEMTSFANEISEAALWHVVADKTEAAYRRGDMFKKRTRMMNDWARYCASPVAARDNVEPIRKVG